MFLAICRPHFNRVALTTVPRKPSTTFNLLRPFCSSRVPYYATLEEENSNNSRANKFGARRFTPTHEYLLQVGPTTARVGITKFAAEKLGEVVFVDLFSKNKVVRRGDPLASLESSKSVGEVYSPVEGRVTAVNLDLMASEGGLLKLNADPEGENSWLVEIEGSHSTNSNRFVEAPELLTEEQYRELCCEEADNSDET